MSNMIEMPGGPRIDHYYGRGIIGVNQPEDSESEGYWEIMLAGDVVIRNYDGEIPQPDNGMTGMQLVGAIFSELETKLLFKLGTEREETIILSPTKYSISDPNIVGGESFPQRPPEMDEEASESDSKGAEEAEAVEEQADENEG